MYKYFGTVSSSVPYDINGTDVVTHHFVLCLIERMNKEVLLTKNTEIA